MTSVTKYFPLHPHNFQLLPQWLLDIMFKIFCKKKFYILFHFKIKAHETFRYCTLVFRRFSWQTISSFFLFAKGGREQRTGWWLKVISISTIARKLCAGGSAHFLKIQLPSKCIILNSGSRSMCLQIFKDFKSNVDFWKVMKIISQKEKKLFSVISTFFGKWPSDISKSVLRPRFIWWQIKKMMTLLWVFPSSNVWNLCLYL